MNNGSFNFKMFNINIQKDLFDASRIVKTIEKYHNTGYAEFEIKMSTDNLKEILIGLERKFHFAYEYLGLNRMNDKLNQELSEYKNKIEKLALAPYLDVLYSPVLFIFKAHLSAITYHVEINNELESVNSHFLLERILRGTPKILEDRSIIPKNEAEVRKEVYNLLIHVFPDTVREFPIVKISKSYKPDIGIKSLKSAIEYKFIDSLTELKTAIGGIFEDIHGYDGSKDWTTFYAVFYMTKSFLTSDQIEAEFKLANVPNNWKLIAVTGDGKRKTSK